MFTKARLKLTIWYLVIILFISGTLSIAFYVRTTRVLDLGFQRIELRLQREGQRFFASGSAPFTLRIRPEEIISAKQEIAIQLVFINAAIVLLFGVAGYFLSGKTLKPIRQALDEQKRFVGDAAHELKTPLTALKTSLEVNLMDKDFPNNAKEVLKENLEDVNSLQSLTDSLLRLAKQDNNSISFEPVSVPDIVKRGVKQLQTLANQKKIKIDINNIPNELIIEGNQESLLHLMIVFLDNAIKYSPDNSEVDVSVTQQPNQITIQVKDHGIGIAKHHLPHIFDRFYRVDTARTRDQAGGYGLGLAVAKQIIDQHHGSISVESEVGKGTTFTITLPIRHVQKHPFLEG